MSGTEAPTRRRINVMEPWLGEEEVEAAAAAIRSGWVAQGPRVAAFEDAFGAAMGAEHAVATSNCTTALHLALVALGVGPGDEVVVPSFSFVATTNAPCYVGAEPVFADVDAATGNVTGDTVAAVVTERTRAVIVVDQGGVPVDLADVRAVCDPRGIAVVEDAACGAGATYRGEPVGRGADVTVWSFHPRKLLTTGEGGMLTTGDAAIAERARRLREHAMSVSAAERHASVLAPPESYDEVGFNYRMTDVQAAIGLVQLGRLPALVERRRELAAGYARALEGVPGVRLVGDPAWGTTNYQSCWLELGPEARLDRESLMAHLAADDISARRGIMAAHLQPAHAGRHRPGTLGTTERLTATTVILPLHHHMGADDHARVVDSLRRGLVP